MRVRLPRSLLCLRADRNRFQRVRLRHFYNNKRFKRRRGQEVWYRRQQRGISMTRDLFYCANAKRFRTDVMPNSTTLLKYTAPTHPGGNQIKKDNTFCFYSLFVFHAIALCFQFSTALALGHRQWQPWSCARFVMNRAWARGEKQLVSGFDRQGAYKTSKEGGVRVTGHMSWTRSYCKCSMTNIDRCQLDYRVHCSIPQNGQWSARNSSKLGTHKFRRGSPSSQRPKRQPRRLTVDTERAPVPLQLSATRWL